MTKRKTIGNNPLDAVIPVPKFNNNVASSKAYAGQEIETPKKIIKERLTVHVPIDLIDRVKNAVYWTPGLTLASLAEEAFTHILEKLEKEHGKVFPARKEDLKGGRPLK